MNGLRQAQPERQTEQYCDLTPFVAFRDKYWTDEELCARGNHEGCQAWKWSFSTNVKGVREMKRPIGEGRTRARTTEPNEPDIRAIREAAMISQSQFAKLIGVMLFEILSLMVFSPSIGNRSGSVP